MNGVIMATTTVSQPRSQASLALRDPMSLIRKEMEDLFSNFWGSSQANLPAVSMSTALDVVESENAFTIKLDAPGLETKDLNIQIHGNTLTISGERKEEKESKDKTYYRMERRHGTFSRTVTLPCEVNENEAAAEYTNGVLSLTLPKAEGSKTKKIPVKAG